MEKILETVSEHTGIPPEDILSRKRDERTAKARHLCMYVSSVFEYSNENIARFIHRTKSDVSLQIRKVAVQARIYKSLRKEIEDIAQSCNKGVLYSKITPSQMKGTASFELIPVASGD
jgi:chromosomal replication initiation ATPase DnaA